MSTFPDDFKLRKFTAENGDQDLEMSGFCIRFASVMCLLVILTGPSSTLFWRPANPTYPSDPQDPYHQGNVFMFYY